MKKNILSLSLLLICFGFSKANAQCYNDFFPFEFNGHTYHIVKEAVSWQGAINCVTQNGGNGYLAEINDVAEQNAISNAIANNAGINQNNTLNEFGTAAVWIGGNDINQGEGNWVWDGNNDNMNTINFWMGGPGGVSINGAYTNWGVNPPEPDNSGGNQNFLTLTIDSTHPNFGKWNDLADNGTNLLYYVVEYNTLLTVADQEFKANFKVFPNPFTNKLTFTNTALLKITKLQLTNNLGQVVKTIIPNNNQNTINLGDLPNGLYFLNVTANNSNHIIKLIH